MLTKWKIFNFKSIREETELDLAPLTIFAGANSSGKSTFIQSILLVAQTLAHKVGSRSVVLNGSLASLGQFDDLKSNNSVSDQIAIKCTLRPIWENNAAIAKQSQNALRNSIYYRQRCNQIKEISCEISFDADVSSANRDLLQIQPRLFATQLFCLSRDDDNVDQKSYMSIHYSTKDISEINDIGISNVVDDHLLSSLDYAVDLDKNSIAEVYEKFRSANIIGCKLRHFLPYKIICSIDIIKEDANAITKVLQGSIYPTFIQNIIKRKLIFSEEIISVLRETLKGTLDINSDSLTIMSWIEKLDKLSRDERMKVQQILREREDLFDRIYQVMRESSTEMSESHVVIPVRLPYVINEATRYLDLFFSSALKYLGPLRDAPKPLYPLAPAADPYDIGIRGENTAYILELHKSKKIHYIPSANFKEAEVDRKTITRTLEAAVTDWLQYLGVANSVKSRDRGKLGHELKVELDNSGSLHDLTHVGVGVSQVLPILVMGLLAGTDSTLVFEQPELHLHPKVQTLLGDFFLSMALCNKQCIIETHSEYLIDRLRFRIAAATPEKELNSQAKIYFVEKPSESSQFREVVINEYGAISDWPEGFFDQSQQQAEQILRAAAMKSKANRRKKNA